VLLSGVAGIALFALLVPLELGRPAPLLRLRPFRDRMFRNGSVTMFMACALLLGVLYLHPLFLQQLLGLTAFESGLTTFPQALGMMLIVQVSSRIYRHVGPRRMLPVALAGLTATSALFLLVGLDTDLWIVTGLGEMGVGLVPENTDLALHTLFALNVPIASVAVLLLSVALLRGHRVVAGIGIALAVVGLAGFVWLSAGEVAGPALYLGLGPGAAERVADYPAAVWRLMIGTLVVASAALGQRSRPVVADEAPSGGGGAPALQGT
jgi:hypothetical protein